MVAQQLLKNLKALELVSVRFLYFENKFLIQIQHVFKSFHDTLLSFQSFLFYAGLTTFILFCLCFNSTFLYPPRG